MIPSDQSPGARRAGRALAGRNFVRQILAGLLSLALILAGIPAPAKAADRHATEAAENMAAGEALAERGQFEEAIGRWREAERGFEGAKDAAGQIGALLHQVEACQSLGQHRLAVHALEAAERLAVDSKNQHCEVEVKAARGAISIFAREADQAEPLLRESLKMARAEKDHPLAATILSNLGILLAAQGRNSEDGNETYQRTDAIAAVTVKGAFTSTSILAGVNPGNSIFGDLDDTAATNLPGTSSIGPIILPSSSTGSASGSHQYAIEATAIKSLKLGANSPLTITSALYIDAAPIGEDVNDIIVRLV